MPGLPRRRRGRLLAACLLALGCALAAAPPVAEARSEKIVRWEASKVFTTAVRFLRLDEGVKVVEKDADAGYVMFELTDDGKTFPGALELVTFDKDGQDAVRIILRIEDRPAYMEAGMLERLERKLRDELGPPPRREPPPKAPPAEPAPEPAPAP